VSRSAGARAADPYPDYPLHVVGESYRQADLEALVEASGLDDGRELPDDSAACHVADALVLEDDNPHDNQAVKVLVLGRHVGYLSRADARRYRRMANAPETVPALIVGGWDRGDRGTGNYGVRLALELPD
jgi:hypothetical protein